MRQGYTDDELQRLHVCLLDILGEIKRVCDELGIRFFMVGGSMIGCHFFNDIDPFDDDVDVGMTRPEYERFLRLAPSMLRKGYVLQWFGNTHDTPFYFAKVRKDGTVFMEESTRNIDMHQGIYVDIFPFDRIPDDMKKRRRQRKMANIINSCFVCKSVWIYKHCGRCELEEPKVHGFLNCLFDRLVVTFIPKRVIYAMLKAVQTRYNNEKTGFYNIVLTDVDMIESEYIDDLRPVKFGGLDVFIPKNHENYLHRHYPNLRKHIPREEAEQFSHRPVKLSF